jgi:hypothetical protein
MAVTKTSLLNKALTLCGAAPITNITDDTQNARVCNRVYEIARQSILTECLWNFATTRSTLSVSAVEMPWEYPGEAYVYVRPATALRIFDVSDRGATWREEGDYIIADTADLGIKYIYDHDDPSKYPAFFAEAFIDKLCSDICFMILNSASKAEAFLTKYTKVSLPKAMTANSQTGTQQEPIDDAWLGAKYHNGGGGDPGRSYS